MFDLDRSGSINMYEFGSLFKYINDWKGLFERIDRDRSGYIEEVELRQGKLNLKQAGYTKPNLYNNQGTLSPVVQVCIGSILVFEKCTVLYVNCTVVDMYDANGSGTIDVSEFGQLFSYINQWKEIIQ